MICALAEPATAMPSTAIAIWTALWITFTTLLLLGELHSQQMSPVAKPPTGSARRDPPSLPPTDEFLPPWSGATCREIWVQRCLREQEKEWSAQDPRRDDHSFAFRLPSDIAKKH